MGNAALTRVGQSLVSLGFIGLFFANAALADSTGLAIPVAEVAKHVSLPPGFEATLFAGEPDVQQPIAMAFDDRGRLWVAECYTYSDAKTNFDLTLHDRILIFEDSTGSGHFDKRKVFWDKGQRLTSIAPGFGGVFATCAPNLIFIPDRDGDDVPDGPPEILIDGWNADAVRHNIVNGLKWGPDGWLYGRHGIMAGSEVGKPGSPAEARTKLNGSIWRYHPTRKIFELFCQGTTNPWGHDWDQFGELFFINTVIGHLWHGIPGAYYQRMYGEHLAPYRYGLLEQTADHYHWDTGKTWQDSRNPGSGADVLGGGHAHSGLMLYQGGSWPARYAGQIFAVNYHGRRINEDLLQRRGSGYLAKHAPDFMKFQDPWFRGIDLDYGADGQVYVLDWSDTGECHENDADGVHRENGRIYKITASGTSGAEARSVGTNSLAHRSTSELIQLQLHPNEWFARHARRILQERAIAWGGADLARARNQLLELYQRESDIPRKLRILFALHGIGADSTAWLQGQLADHDEHVRSWAVRFLVDSMKPDQELIPKLAQLAATDPSPVVRLYLASALQRFPAEVRGPLALALAQHGEDAGDQNLPLMLWYGIEPMANSAPADAVRVAEQSRIPLVRQYISRRLAETLDTQPVPVESLLQMAGRASGSRQLDILRGLGEALRGRRKAPKPAAWESVRKSIVTALPPGLAQGARIGDSELLRLLREIGVIFGDPWALEELRSLVLGEKVNVVERRLALAQLVDARVANLRQLLDKLIENPELTGAAARGLLVLDEPGIPEEVLSRWPSLSPEDRIAIVGLMATRVSFANALLDAVAAGKVRRAEVTAADARKIRAFNQEPLNRKLSEVWGEVRSSDADKARLMTQYRNTLTPERLKQADLPHGREVFNRLCAVCHKLYGQGAAIGPDLTGGGRANLDYLLENIVDPNAIVPADYKAAEVELKGDRSFTGVIVSQTERLLTLQTPTEKMTIDRSDIVKLRQSNNSLMPEGLLQGLKEAEICNLIGYLMAPSQVPLP